MTNTKSPTPEALAVFRRIASGWSGNQRDEVALALDAHRDEVILSASFEVQSALGAHRRLRGFELGMRDDCAWIRKSATPAPEHDR